MSPINNLYINDLCVQKRTKDTQLIYIMEKNGKKIELDSKKVCQNNWVTNLTLK